MLVVSALLASSLAISSLMATASATGEIPTRLRLTVSSRHVHVGHHVRFEIQLSSRRSNCYAGQRIKWFRDGVYRASLKTDQRGAVSFVRHPTLTHRYRAKYVGRRWGSYPHRHICLPSASQIRTVTVGHG